MRHLRCLITRTVTFLIVMLAIGCESQQPTPYQPTATVEDLMRSIIDPSADAIWAGHQGHAAADLFAEMEAAAPEGPRQADLRALPALLDHMLGGVSVRPPQGGS